jgi:hypothetical protein
MARGYNSDFNNKWKTEMVGVQLNFTNNQTGKKVFDWTFSVAGKKDRISVEVKAYNNGTDMWFQASGPHIPEAVKSTDINALRSQVQDILTEQVTLLTNVEWEDWFEVIVNGDNSDFNDSRYSALGANLKVQVNRLRRGIDPQTGRVLTVNNGAVTDFPQPSSIDDPEVTVNGFRTGSSVEKSYIPATPENRAAIDDILLRMQTLRNSIAVFLSQDNITDTLDQNLMKVLPKP